MTDFVLIHDEEHEFLDGLIDIPLNISSVNLSSINKAYIQVSLEVPITTTSKPSLLGFLYQEFNDKRSRPYPIVSQQQSVTLDFSNCDSFLFVPTNRLISDYILKLYVANDSASSENTGSIDLSNYITNSELNTALDALLASFPDVPYQHGHSISEITGLNDVLDDHEARLNTLENSQSNSGTSSLELVKVTVNSTLESNKRYFFAEPDLICLFPSNPIIGDYIRLVNGGNDTRVNHGNSNQTVLNNTTLTFNNAESGIVLKPYSAIDFVYVGNGLWVSNNKNRQVNNFKGGATLEPTESVKTYTPTELIAYTYFSGNGLSRINDGNLGAGVMKTNPTNEFGVICTFSQNVRLTRFYSGSGQFNGGFNAPTGLDIYKGNSINPANLIYSTNNHSTIDYVEVVVTTDALVSQYLFNYRSNAPDISIIELKIWGKSSDGGEVVVN